MDNKILERLQTFIKHERWEYKFPLDRNVRLYQDLNIYGDDAVTFILAYGKEFGVDVSNFMAADYFKGEGVDFLGGIIRLFSKEKKEEPKLKELTIGDLEKGVIAGKLDEEVINS